MYISKILEKNVLFKYSLDAIYYQIFATLFSNFKKHTYIILIKIYNNIYDNKIYDNI